MRSLVHVLSTVALVAATFGVVPLASARERLSPQQQLDKLLAGRVAGKPVDCLPLLGSEQSQIIDKTAIVYGTGRTLYVNRPDNASSLNDDDVMVTELRGTSQLCSIDVVRLHDRASHMYTGFVALGKFVPYTRVAER